MLKRKSNEYREFFRSKDFPQVMGIVQTQNTIQRLECEDPKNRRLIVLRAKLDGMYKIAKYRNYNCNYWQRILVEGLVAELEKEENNEH